MDYKDYEKIIIRYSDGDGCFFDPDHVDQVIIIECENEAWICERDPFENILHKHTVPLDFYYSYIHDYLVSRLCLDDKEIDDFFEKI